jgi:hypothetical protein
VLKQFDKSVINAPQPDNLKNVNSNPMLLEAHIVDKRDIFYSKGRILAKNVYKKVWNTENLLDNNHYAIVVSFNRNVLGNLNIQLKKEENPLKSELFFGLEHWQSYFQVKGHQIAEISALAIAADAPIHLRKPIMMMLIKGLQNLCGLLGIKYLVTIQHEYLVRILTKTLHLPFIKNTVVTQPLKEIPNDNYWKRERPPAIYYLETLGKKTLETCQSFFCYLNFLGIQTAFYPRITNCYPLSYAAFRKNWQGK